MSFDVNSRSQEEKALEELRSLTNWKKWGDADERGALNYITPEVVVRAASSVRTGRTFPLGQLLRPDRAPALRGRPAPMHFMEIDGGDFAAGHQTHGDGRFAADVVVLPVHGVTTHVDALCHIWAGDELYNGFKGNLVRSYGGLRLGVENIGAIVTGGVLLDIARYRGVDVLDADDLISEDDVSGCAKQQGVEMQSGDAVLIRTGWPRVFAEDPDRYSAMQPGVGPSAALALANAEVSLIGCDNSAVNGFSGPMPGERRDSSRPVDPRQGLNDLHLPLIRNLGMYLLELLNLEELAKADAYRFLFCLAPLLILGGTGSPVNPVAVE
jgi:kynurenine formamidase